MAKSIGKFKSLRFPEELGTDEVPAYVRFTPQVVKYGGTRGLNPIQNPGVLSNKGQAFSLGPGVVNNPFSQIASQIGGVIDSFASAASSVINSIGNIFQSTSITSAFSKIGKVVSGKVKIGDFDIQFGMQTMPDQLTSAGSISLFLPEELAARSTVDYSAEEVGARGIEAANLVRKSGADSAGLASGAIDILKSTVRDAMISAGPQKNALAMGKGLVANNFSFQIFNGVGHRNFDYSFKMVAKNEKESQAIKDICDMFLFYMLPARQQDNDLHFYEIPCQWKIEYQKQGKRMEYHQQPKACFLTGVDVAYGGESTNNLYNNSAPMEVTLRLGFVEIEPLYRTGDEV